MKVLITGATGFVGKAVTLRLLRDGHQPVVWARSAEGAAGALGADVQIVTGADGDLALRRAVNEADAIVNLAGEPVFGGRWSASRRRRLVDSRVETTRKLVAAMAAAGGRPRVLVSASAVGYYGDRGDAWVDERSEAGEGFLADLCRQWEAEAARAATAGNRVAILRIGIVLGRGGGALAKMLPPFRAGVGGPLGSGQQFVPWIHLDDLVELIATALRDDRYSGAINAVAPHPVTNRAFSRAIGRALHRPAILRAPALVLRAALGASASALLGGQRVVPRELRERGFAFRYTSIDDALAAILVRDEPARITREDGHYVLRQSAVVDAPLEEVFAFFSRAENLGALTPREMSFSILSETPIEMRPGTRIDYRIQLGLLSMRWRTRIEAWDAGRRFVDVQERGPYRSWHHEHTFSRLGDRTLMEDVVRYQPPLGWLGRVAHRLFIARTLSRIFAYRAEVIGLRFGTADAPAARAA